MDNRAEHPRDANPTHDERPQGDITIEPTFVLLFSVQLAGAFGGFRAPISGVTPHTSEHLKAYDERLSGLERHVFGDSFVATGRTKRWPLGGEDK